MYKKNKEEPTKDMKAETQDDQQSAEYLDPAEISSQEKEKSEQSKVEYYMDIARRTQADFDNFRKRNLSLRAEAIVDGKTETVKAFLPVIDNIDRAIALAKEENSILEGLRLVRKQIDQTLSNLGVEEMGEAGELFDPNLHEAVMQVEPADGQESGVIAEVFHKGYKMGDKVIRYTMVKVTG